MEGRREVPSAVEVSSGSAWSWSWLCPSHPVIFMMFRCVIFYMAGWQDLAMNNF